MPGLTRGRRVQLRSFAAAMADQARIARSVDRACGRPTSVFEVKHNVINEGRTAHLIRHR